MRRYWLLTGLSILIFIALPLTAQDVAPLPFATNTPRPPEIIITTPAAPVERYGLRTWQERDLVNLLYTSVRRLTPGAVDLQKSIQMIQYELERRFPGAPHIDQQREELLMAMLSAPPGSLDMRAIARPYIETLLNEPSNSPLFDYNGFQIDIIPADIDGLGQTDAVLHIRYPKTAAPAIYEDYLVAQISDSGRYRILEATPQLPAAPLGDVVGIMLMGVNDLNSDGLDEMTVIVRDSDINQHMLIYGWRGGSLVNLVEPGQQLDFGEVIEWPGNGRAFLVKAYRTESEAWQCVGEQPVTWNWTLNFFRPTPDPSGFFFQNSANCLLYGADPLFEKPVEEAISTIQTIVSLAPSQEDYSIQRAKMILAMLNLLGGQADLALSQARDLAAVAAPGSWLAQQTAAFISAAEIPNTTPLQVCAALVIASDHGACDVDQALNRLLTDNPLQRDSPIEDQLAGLGINVLDTFTISQVGRVDRQGVRFDLSGIHWWAFAPLDPDFYTAEQVAPRPGFDRATPPTLLVVAPPVLYDALLVNNAPALALTVKDNLLHENPGAVISPDVLFIEALSYDLLANRALARQAYFDLWQNWPLSVWGQLAAAHLEQR